MYFLKIKKLNLGDYSENRDYQILIDAKFYMLTNMLLIVFFCDNKKKLETKLKEIKI